jgi:hypothetical protein
MEIKIINGRQVIVCVHCDGTGLCQHADTLSKFQEGGVVYVAWECTTCGNGLKVEKGEYPVGRPGCSTCKGKGFHVI